MNGNLIKNQIILNGSNSSVFIFFYSFLLPLVRLRQKKEGAIPCRSSGEAVGCPVRTTERRCAQRAHSPLRLGSYWLNSYIPPVPKRCVERKALSCPPHIIVDFRPVVGGNLQFFCGGKSRPSIFFHGKDSQILYSILSPHGEMSRGEITFLTQEESFQIRDSVPRSILLPTTDRENELHWAHHCLNV